MISGPNRGYFRNSIVLATKQFDCSVLGLLLKGFYGNYALNDVVGCLKGFEDVYALNDSGECLASAVNFHSFYSLRLELKLWKAACTGATSNKLCAGTKLCYPCLICRQFLACCTCLSSVRFCIRSPSSFCIVAVSQFLSTISFGVIS